MAVTAQAGTSRRIVVRLFHELILRGRQTEFPCLRLYISKRTINISGRFCIGVGSLNVLRTMSSLFLHTHPYPPYIPESATKLIVGTLPPPRFTTGELKEGDVDFCYGSRDGQLWVILDRLFHLGLLYENTPQAIEQRAHFLQEHGIGVCDMVAFARRAKINASDAGMQDVELRDLVRILQKHPRVNTLLFTGGNSKNGPEYLFRRHLKKYKIPLKPESLSVPRIHSFLLPSEDRKIRTVTLTAPSGSANRAVGSFQEYKERKAANPNYTTIDFRVEQYRPFF